MSSGVGLPNLLKTDVMDRPVNQRLETDILYPVSSNQQVAKFVFDRKGILDSNSCLNIAATLPLLEPDAGGAFTDSGSSLPSATGAMALVKRCFLEIGGRRVATLDEVGQYATWKRLHFSNEYREGVLQVKQGGSDVFTGSASNAYPPVQDGTIGRRSNETIQTAAANATKTPKHQRLTASANTTPSWCLPLSSLIPMLKGFQIPLFAIAQEVCLIVEFSSGKVGDSWVATQGWGANAGDGRSSIVLPQLYIMADYLYYPDEMENIADAITNQGGYDLLYDEIQTQNAFQAAAGATATGFNITNQLALGGKKVKSIVCQRTDVATQLNNVGNYYSLALASTDKYNYTIDSKPFYSVDLGNAALQFSETCRIDDAPLRVPQVRYSKKGGNAAINGFTRRTFNGYNQTSEWGSQNWRGLRLSNAAGEGLRMSNLPVLHNNFGDMAGGEEITDYNNRYFITCQRMINISNGLVNMIE